MEALWHSIINVLIVIFSFLFSFIYFLEKRPFVYSVVAFAFGVGMYSLHIFGGYSDGTCKFEGSQGILETLTIAESCIDSYSLDISMAQVVIIGSVLVWLVLAWQPVMRKLEQDEAHGGGDNET